MGKIPRLFKIRIYKSGYDHHSVYSQWQAGYRATKRHWNVAPSPINNEQATGLCSFTWEGLSNFPTNQRHELTGWRAENAQNIDCNSKTQRPSMSAYLFSLLLWTHAQRASMLYFADVFFIFFFIPALVGQTAERIFTKLSHVVDISCYLRTY